MSPPAANPRTRPAKAALSLEAIVAAALAVVDEVGFEAASMRRIAQALDTGPASLYVYVADRHELMTLAYDRALGDVVLPTEVDGSWRHRLELLVGRIVDALAAHDDLASVALGDVPLGPQSLRTWEEMSRLLRGGGVADAQVGWAADLLGQYVASSALEEAAWLRAQRARAVVDPGGATAENMSSETQGRLDAVYATLDPQRYPTLHALREHFTSGDGTGRPAWKLRIIVDGLLAQS